MSPSHSLTTHPLTATAAGEHLRRLRRQARLSQLELSLITGISQRHLSCVETGRAKPSPSTLHALLSALDAPLEQRNEIFLAAGFAPRYMASTPDAPAMAMVHDAIEHILQANNPAPALVIASNWDITAANASAGLLLAMLGVQTTQPSGLNLLDTLLRLVAWATTWSMPMRYAQLPGNARPGKPSAILSWLSCCASCLGQPICR